MESASFISSIRPSEWCQFIFVVLGAGAIANDAAPQSFRDQIMCYGARQASPVATKDKESSNDKSAIADDEVTGGLAIFRGILKYSGLLIPVPHGWFTHFYIMLTAANLFWFHQYVTGGEVMHWLATKELMPSVVYPHAIDSVSAAVPREQVLVVMGMLTFQGVRRLLECLFVQKQSPNSYMLVMHWVLTFIFYSCMSISVWIEGAATVLEPASLTDSPFDVAAISRIAVVLPIFFAASFCQFHSHKHLASLVKYTLPTAGLFKYFVCPHYFCECVNYVCLAVMAAPSDALFSKTMLCALFFTAANLGVTARSTRPWYEGKFGKDCVSDRWNMIPFIF